MLLDTTRAASQKCNQRGRVPAYKGCEVPSGSRPAWCVVATKPRAERRAHASLHRFGFTAFLPLITSQRRDRSWITRPLWPGYCFVRLDLTRPWSVIRYAPGVFQLLMTDGQPAICPDDVLEAVQSALQAAQALAATRQRWNVGTPCSLALGPLRGLPAIITAIDENQARVAVMMLGQLRVVRIDMEHLRARDE